MNAIQRKYAAQEIGCQLLVIDHVTLRLNLSHQIADVHQGHPVLVRLFRDDVVVVVDPVSDDLHFRFVEDHISRQFSERWICKPRQDQGKCIGSYKITMAQPQHLERLSCHYRYFLRRSEVRP